MTRRANGEGSIRRRANGLYEGRFTGSDGKSHSVYGRRKADVVARLREETAAAEQGIRPTTDRDTVGVMLERWLETTRSTVKLSTWAQRESHVRVHLMPGLGHIPLKKLTPDDVQDLLNRLSRKPALLSPRTIHHIRATLRVALNDALDRRLVSWNVAERAKPPRLFPTSIVAFDAGAARTFLEAVATERLGPLYTVALVYGLRLGECLGLRWQDIDEHSIHVRQAYQRVARQSLFEEPKSHMSRRTLPRFAIADRALELQRARVAEMQLKAGPAWKALDLVFPGPGGGPLNPSSTTRALRESLVRLGLPELTFHALRHSCASIHNELGTDPRTIQLLLGHTSAALTVQVYTHITAAQMREAAARFDAALGTPTQIRTQTSDSPIVARAVPS